jgi:protein SCO1
MLRTIRIVAWSLIAALGAAVVLATTGVRLPGMPQGPIAGQLPLAAAIGGPFSLPATTGGTVSSDSLKGKPFALFFGFTYCPDVCPTTLLDLSNTIKQLGPDADRMNFLFVSVDPGRDTIEQLKIYLTSFDPHIIGATGTEAQIAGIARAYRAVYERVATKESYTMNHTATTYLMDAKGQFHGTLIYQENPDVVLKKLRRLIAGS